MTEVRVPKPMRPHYGYKIVILLTGLFIVTGLLMVTLAGDSVPGGGVRASLSGLGISFLSFGVTTILLSYFTNEFFGDRMAERVGVQLLEYVEQVDNITKDAMDKLPSMVERNLDQVVGSFNEFVPLFSNCAMLGLANVYLTRPDAMKEFSQPLTTELERAKSSQTGDGSATQPGRLWFVSSSMKGFLDMSNSEFDGRRIIDWAAELARAGKLDVKILMTDPDRGEQ